MTLQPTFTIQGRHALVGDDVYTIYQGDSCHDTTLTKLIHVPSWPIHMTTSLSISIRVSPHGSYKSAMQSFPILSVYSTRWPITIGARLVTQYLFLSQTCMRLPHDQHMDSPGDSLFSIYCSMT